MLRLHSSTRRAILRGIAALVAVLHLSVAPAVAFADAQGAAAASQIAATGHVESEGGVPHRALHADGCALCQFLSVAGISATTAAPAAVVAAHLGIPGAPVSLAASIAAHGEPPSRAPPSLS
jgi:hypothetical protein